VAGRWLPRQAVAQAPLLLASQSRDDDLAADPDE
jgi:hypothetical protein